MDPVGVVAIQAERDRLHRGGGARHGHERSSLPRRHGGLDLDQGVRRLGRQRSEFLRRGRIAADVAFGEAHAPHLRRDRMLRAAGFGPHDELGRPAADVLDQERAVGRIQPVRAAEEGQPGLLLTGDDLRGAAAVPAHGLDERLAVLGIAHGARGAHADAPGPERACSATEHGEHLHGAGQSLRVQSARAVHVLAQPRDHHVARELGRGRARHAGGAPEIITGEQEAGLSYLGGTQGLDPADGPFLVQDIGGGWTEFVVGTEPGLAEHAISTQMGSVRLTERHVRRDPPSPGELAALATEATGHPDPGRSRRAGAAGSYVRGRRRGPRPRCKRSRSGWIATTPT